MSSISCLSFMAPVVMLANDQTDKSRQPGTEIMTRSCVGCAQIPDGNEQQLKSAPRIVNCYVANETKLKLQTINHICTHRY